MRNMNVKITFFFFQVIWMDSSSLKYQALMNAINNYVANKHRHTFTKIKSHTLIHKHMHTYMHNTYTDTHSHKYAYISVIFSNVSPS